MEKMNSSFPICYKNQHNTFYYKINSKEEFEELRITGNTYFYHKTIITQHPERVYLNDLMENLPNYFIPCEETEFLNIKELCEKTFKKIGF